MTICAVYVHLKFFFREEVLLVRREEGGGRRFYWLGGRREELGGRLAHGNRAGRLSVYGFNTEGILGGRFYWLGGSIS